MVNFENDGDRSEDKFAFWSLGNEYFEAANVLFNTPPTRVNYNLIIYYLLGHAAELYSKAYLNQKGVTTKELRTTYRHNLKKLIKQCEKLGLKSETEGFEAILALSTIYNAKGMEYRGNKKEAFPNKADLLKQVNKLGDLSFSEASSF